MSEKVWILQGESLADNAVKKAFLSLFRPYGTTHGHGWLRFEHTGEVDVQKLDVLQKQCQVDVAQIDDGIKFTDFDAVFFDMDSTLCSTETLDEIAAILGVGEECARITHEAMTGKITDYAASLKARVALLKNMPADCIDAVYADMKPNLGVESFLKAAQTQGLKTYIVSSGFTCLTDRMCKRLDMTATCANRIEIIDGKFTGRVFGPVDDTILSASGKANFVQKTMDLLSSNVKRAICCGDGSNDIKMIDLCGFGVGFRPKPILRPHCTVALDYVGFDGLLNLFVDTRGQADR